MAHEAAMLHQLPLCGPVKGAPAAQGYLPLDTIQPLVDSLFPATVEGPEGLPVGVQRLVGGQEVSRTCPVPLPADVGPLDLGVVITLGLVDSTAILGDFQLLASAEGREVDHCPISLYRPISGIISTSALP